MSPRLSQYRHCLTQVPLAERVRVCEALHGGQIWRRPTDAELAYLLAADGDDPNSIRPADLHLFSIPPSLAAAAHEIVNTHGDTAPEPRGTDVRVQTLVSELVDFLQFIDSPLRGPCSIRVAFAQATQPDPLPPPRMPDAVMNDATEPGIGAHIRVGDAPGALVYVAHDEAGAPLRVRVEVARCEGVFGSFELTRVSLYASDPARPMTMLSLLPDAPGR
jgi:hypothetical protein